MGWGGTRTVYVDRDNSADLRRQREEMQSINKDVQNLQRNNEKLQESIRKSNEINRKFQEEIKRRDQEKEDERKHFEEMMQKNIDQQERIKKELRAARKRKDEEGKRESESLKKKKKQLEEERKKVETQFEDKENNEKNIDYFENVKCKMEQYKKDIKRFIRDDDKNGIELLLTDIDNDVLVYQEVLLNSNNINKLILFQLHDTICFGYEEFADFFYTSKQFHKAIELYEKVESFDARNKKSDLFYYKKGRALFSIGEYTKTIESLLLFEKEQSDNDKGKSRYKIIKNELILLYLESYMKIEDSQNSAKYLNEVIDNLQENKTTIFKFLDLYYDYIQYNTSNNNDIVRYFAYQMSLTRDNKELKDRLNQIKFDERPFYQAIYEYREGNYKESLSLLKNLNEKNNKIVKLVYYKILSEQEKVTVTNIDDIESLLDDISKLLAGKEAAARKIFLEKNNSLIYIDCSTSKDFMKFYQNLFFLKLKFYFNNSQYDEIMLETEKIIEKYDNNDYEPSSQMKMFFSEMYHFFNNNNSSDKNNFFYTVLEKYSTKLELEKLLSNEFKNEKKFDDLYAFTNENISFMGNAFYRTVVGRSKVNSTPCFLLETYRENLSRVNRERRVEALFKEKKLGEQYNCFTTIYDYEVLEEITKIAYPVYKNSFSNYLKESGTFSDENAEEKINFAKQLLEIFVILEKENIILSTLNPEKIVITKEDQLVLRDTFFDSSFKSESQSSMASSRISSSNRYKVPDEKRNRDLKANNYLLGLLLYELFYGKYIFDGVTDFAIITRLHKDLQLDKSQVYSLRNRWIVIDKNAITVRVEKVRVNTDLDINISSDIQKIIKKLLDNDKEKRAGLEEVKQLLFNNDLKEDMISQGKSYSKNTETVKSETLSKTKLKELLQNLKINRVTIKDEKLFNSFFTKNIKTIRDNNISYGLEIDSEQSLFGIKKYGAKFKIEIFEEKEDFLSKRAVPSPKGDSNGKIILDSAKIDIDKLIDTVSDKMMETEADMLSDFLFQTRQNLYEIKDNKDIKDLIDDEYLSLCKKVSINELRSGSKLDTESYVAIINNIMSKI